MNKREHNAKERLSLLFPFRVRYSEIDAQGVVFNAHYLTYLDTAVTEYLRWQNFNVWQQAATGFDFHTVKTVVEYRAPIKFDDEIEVGVKLGSHGRSSLTWELAIFHQGDERVLSTGEVVWVYVDMAAHKATPIPEELLVHLRLV
ncbi:MAG: acyl-CoA thioesterase [Ardenticatenaceae bacterium]|nr:acyl-CoA thioesterase [Ardenticatenaceae bacterium]